MKNCIRKTLLAGALLVGATASQAQFNKVYNYVDFNQQPVNSTVTDLVSVPNSHQTALIRIDSVQNLYPVFTMMALKETDISGASFMDRQYYLSDSTLRLEPWRMVTTPDNGYLVVGRALRLNLQAPAGRVWSDPFAARFNSAGDFLWIRVYPTNPAAYLDEPPTAVARIPDDTTEGYVIVRAGAPLNSFYSGDVSINALRIDGNGNVIWNKRYSDGNRSFSGDSTLRDYPSAVVHVPDSSYYLIAGTQQIVNIFYGDTTLMLMGINNAGQIVKSHRTVPVPSFPSGVDAVYDPTGGATSVAISYIQGRNFLADSTGARNRSQVGLLKLSTSLNAIIYQKYYWQADSIKEYRGTRIKYGADRRDYLIATDVFHSNAPSSQASLLKVSLNGNPIIWQRYNILRTNEAHALLSHRVGGAEWNIIGGATNSWFSPFNDSRIIAATANGVACGSRKYPIINAALTDSFTMQWYTHLDTSGSIVRTLWEPHLSPGERDCDVLNPDYGRSLNVGAVQNDESLKVYPTLVGANTTTLTAEADFYKASTLYIAFHSADGRRIAQDAVSVHSGQNKVSVSIPELSPGVYLISVHSADRSVSKVFRIVSQ